MVIKIKTNINESLLIDHFIAGDVDALEQIYNETKDFVFRVIFKMVHNQLEAEDLMQDVFIKLFETRNKFLRQASLKTWIYRLAVNHTLNHIKKRKRAFARVLKFETDSPVVDITEGFIEADNINLIQRLLDKINPDYKICLLLKENEKMSYENIAQTLGINIGTVRSRINRAKQHLVELYKKGGE